VSVAERDRTKQLPPVALTTSLRTLIIAFQVANTAGVFGTASIGVFLFGRMWLLAECGFLLANPTRQLGRR